MAKKLLYDGSEEVVVKYATKDAKGVNIDIGALSSGISAKVNKSGDTITGPLTIQNTAILASGSNCNLGADDNPFKWGFINNLFTSKLSSHNSFSEVDLSSSTVKFTTGNPSSYHYYQLPLDGSTSSSSPDIIATRSYVDNRVSGTNDGTNWTSLTIGGTTKAIPTGGAAPSNMVTTDTAQNISGQKTFNSDIIISTNGKIGLDSNRFTLEATSGPLRLVANESNQYLGLYSGNQAVLEAANEISIESLNDNIILSAASDVYLNSVQDGNQVVTKRDLTAAGSAFVTLAGSQTISGAKTFTNNVVLGNNLGKLSVDASNTFRIESTGSDLYLGTGHVQDSSIYIIADNKLSISGNEGVTINSQADSIILAAPGGVYLDTEASGNGVPTENWCNSHLAKSASYVTGITYATFTWESGKGEHIASSGSWNFSGARLYQFLRDVEAGSRGSADAFFLYSSPTVNYDLYVFITGNYVEMYDGYLSQTVFRYDYSTGRLLLDNIGTLVVDNAKSNFSIGKYGPSDMPTMTAANSFLIAETKQVVNVDNTGNLALDSLLASASTKLYKHILSGIIITQDGDFLLSNLTIVSSISAVVSTAEALESLFNNIIAINGNGTIESTGSGQTIQPINICAYPNYKFIGIISDQLSLLNFAPIAALYEDFTDTVTAL